MSAIHNEPAAKSKYRRTLSEHKVMHWGSWERLSSRALITTVVTCSTGMVRICACCCVCWPKLIQLQSCSAWACSCRVLDGTLQMHSQTTRAMLHCVVLRDHRITAHSQQPVSTDLWGESPTHCSHQQDGNNDQNALCERCSLYLKQEMCDCWRLILDL